jgi:DHA2 family multidrug resistance protein
MSTSAPTNAGDQRMRAPEAGSAPPTLTPAEESRAQRVPEVPHGAEHKYLIALAVVLAALMQVIDSSIVNVALPDMMGNLGANLDEIAWVSTGYIIASVIVMPLTGFLGDLFGRKRYFVGSIILFTTASFFCGASHSLTTLVLWRLIQGVGGGALMTVSQAVLFESFPPEEAGTAMALFGLGVMVGPTIGPTLGGYLVDNMGWPWIFYINIPVGILAAAMIAAYVHDPEHQTKPPVIDYQGITLLAISVFAIQYVLEHGQREDWFESRQIMLLTVLGIASAIGLVWRELTTKHPAIDFRVLKHRQMWVGTLLGIVMGVGLYAMSFTLPVFMQSELRMTAQQTGFVLLPGALATAVSMAVVGRLTSRIDSRLLVTAGALIFAAAAWMLSLITSQSGADDFLWPLLLRGIGLGMMFVPLTTLTLANLSSHELSQGAGLYNFFRQLGGSFGIAVIATLVTRYTTQFREVLGEHVTTANPLALQRIEMLTRGMMTHGVDRWTAHQRALAILDQQLYGQASVIAYSHIYIITMLSILVLIPMLLLVGKTRSAGGAHMVME